MVNYLLYKHAQMQMMELCTSCGSMSVCVALVLALMFPYVSKYGDYVLSLEMQTSFPVITWNR